MSAIHVLDPSTIDKIAAGEVIERPASVVKELVENSIDAGADRITVEIQEGGIRLIRVTDNGCGIESDAVAMAFLRHATSKISSADELHSIVSLGFRGEALASIAAVARVTLTTRTAGEESGVEIEIEGGTQRSLRAVGAPEGTRIEVRQLFYNVPVRRKFLKSPMTEAIHVSEVVERLSLSHPHISFRLITNGQEKIVTGGSGNVHETLMRLYGPAIGRHMLPVDRDRDGLTLTGLIGAPSVSRGNRAQETFFVNGRIVRSDALQKALEEAYRGYTMQHRFPICALYLTIAPEDVDINIHPTKSEVRFARTAQVRDLIIESVREVLASQGQVEQVSIPSPPPAPANEPKPSPAEPAAEAAGRLDYFMDQMRERVQAYHADPPPAVKKRQAEAEQASAQEQLRLFKDEVQQQTTARHYRLLGQLFGTYWLVESDQTLYIVDQHAAHEKVLYEETVTALKNRQHTAQRVSPPIIVHLTARQEQALMSYRSQFEELGYDMEPFGEHTIALSAVPANLFSIREESLFTDILDQAEEDIHAGASSDMILERIASLSCKAAVKGNTTVDEKQMNALLERLFALENPYHCPHGRPTMIAMTRRELDKKFKRIV